MQGGDSVRGHPIGQPSSTSSCFLQPYSNTDWCSCIHLQVHPFLFLTLIHKGQGLYSTITLSHPLMPASKDTHVQHQATPETPSYYRPLLQLDNSSSWTAEQPGPAFLEEPLDAPPDMQPPSHIQHEVVADDDDDYPPTKHEGRLLSAIPTPVVSPIPRSASSAFSPSPPTSHGHTRSPVLAR